VYVLIDTSLLALPQKGDWLEEGLMHRSLIGWGILTILYPIDIPMRALK